MPEYLAPQSIPAVHEVAGLIAAAEWAPSPYRDLEGKYVVAKIALAIMHGAAVGLGPFAAVQSIAVIEGLPTIWGDGALALVEHSGLIEDRREDYVIDEEEGLTAICTMRRRYRPTPIIGRFSTAMADQAGLTQKDGPWQSYPRRMLMMRARSWALRDGFADVLRGLSIREEVEDYTGEAIRLPEPTVAPLQRRTTLTTGRVAPRPRFGGGTALQCAVAKPADEGRDIVPDPTPTESFTLIDAEGGFREVAGADALRVAFEELVLDPHLPPGQIVGLWESNESARAVIAKVFGATALEAADARVQAASAQYQEQHAERRPSPRARRRSPKRSAASQPELLLLIDPNWTEDQVFQHYRTGLAVLQKETHKASVFAKFRRVNQDVEARLRSSLPHLISEIDAIYAWVATHAA